MWSEIFLNNMENITHIILVKIILSIPSENQTEVGKKWTYPVLWLITLT